MDDLVLDADSLFNIADIIDGYCAKQREVVSVYHAQIMALESEWRDDETFGTMVQELNALKTQAIAILDEVYETYPKYFRKRAQQILERPIYHIESSTPINYTLPQVSNGTKTVINPVGGSQKSFGSIGGIFHRSTSSSSSEQGQVGANSVESIESIKSWIGNINPNYYNHFLPNKDAYHVNCGSCAFAVEQRLSGRDRTKVASDVNIGTDEVMEKATGKKCKYMNPEKIKKILEKRGAGAHLIVGINRHPIVINGKKINQSGHWFNVYYDGNKVYTVEGQSGNIYDFPHDYGDISEWCALI